MLGVKVEIVFKIWMMDPPITVIGFYLENDSLFLTVHVVAPLTRGVVFISDFELLSGSYCLCVERLSNQR